MMKSMQALSSTVMAVITTATEALMVPHLMPVIMLMEAVLWIKRVMVASSNKARG